MRLYYTANAINLYIKKTGKNLNELANMIGIGYATLNRYSRGERFPDIDILLRICNALRIRINNFFIHPDIELTELRIYREEEWGDIHFRYDRIEAVRMEKGYSKKQLVEKIKSDKKSDGDGVDMVLIKNIGEPEIIHLSFEKIEELLEK